jgi:hypothetical protein
MDIMNRAFDSRILSPVVFLTGLLFGSGLIAVLAGSLEITSSQQDISGTILSNAARGGILSFLSLLLYLFLIFRSRACSKTSTAQLLPLLFLSGLTTSSVLLYFSSWTSFPFGYIGDPLLAHAAFCSVFAFFLFGAQARGLVIITGSVLGILFLLILFLQQTGGAPVYTDDHGSVTYRLSLLRNYFPSIPLYNTEWNAGTDWRDFFATGILNVFFLFYPLIYGFNNIDTAYRFIVPGIIFFITPLSCFFAARILSCSIITASLAALLSVTASASWYKWSLGYGSMGFVCSTALFPLFLASAIRTLDEAGKTPKTILATVIISGTLCIFWSAQGLSMIPLILFALLASKKLFRSRRIVATAILLCLINIPWILIFVHVSKVSNFVSLENSSHIESTVEENNSSSSHPSTIVKGKKESVSKKNILRAFRENVLKIHPLLYLLGIPALLVLPWKRAYQLPYLATSIWLFLLGTVFVHLKPQMELDRMIVILALVLSIPVAEGFSRILQQDAPLFSLISLGRASGLSLILLGVLAIAGVLQKKSWIPYHTRSSNFDMLAQILSEHTGNGRALFSGFILHEFDGSHIAPLPGISNVPIMASSPVHNLWWYTDVIPEEYRQKGPAGIEEFLDLYNVTVTIARERVWKDYFRNSSFRYDEIAVVGGFVIFRRNHAPESFFHKGSGKIVSQGAQGLTFTTSDDTVVLSFNYFPFLTVDTCSDISPYKVSDSVSFIALTGCSSEHPATVKSASGLRRIMQ